MADYYDRIRAAERDCMNLWGALVLHIWLYDFVVLVFLYTDECVNVWCMKVTWMIEPIWEHLCCKNYHELVAALVM
jgi:hypothetical protein